MTKYNLFYCDHFESEDVSADDAHLNHVDKAVILKTMDDVLHSSSNFVGLIDANENTLQFMVDDDDEGIVVDLPMPSQNGSYTKRVSLDEAQDIVRNLEGLIDVDAIGGMSFTPW